MLLFFRKRSFTTDYTPVWYFELHLVASINDSNESLGYEIYDSAHGRAVSINILLSSFAYTITITCLQRRSYEKNRLLTISNSLNETFLHIH